MAATAIGTELAIVNIVGAMAVLAAATVILHLIERAAMAVIAGDILVCASQRKVALRRMIE